MPEPTPDAWAQIRYDYEHTDRPIGDICLEYGISSGTLRDRMRRWRWTRRRPPIPREGPPPVEQPRIERSGIATRLTPSLRLSGGGSSAAARQGEAAELPPLDKGRREPGWGDLHAPAAHPTPPVFAAAQTVDPPPPGEGEEAAAIVPRLQSAVARVLPAIEATIARLAAGPHHPREMEQAGRALGALTRTLRELNALLSQHHARAAAAEYDDDMPEDIDAWREELARRIRAFVESRSGHAGEEAKLEET